MSASVSVRRDAGLATVVVAGEIDAANAAALEESINEAIGIDGVDTVLVDLSALKFLDSSGIGALLKGRRLADRRTIDYRVAGAEDMVRRVLELTGVWEHLSGEPSRPAET